MFLADIIVLNGPFDAVISFGDLILAVGLCDVTFWASRKPKRTPHTDDPEPAAGLPPEPPPPPLPDFRRGRGESPVDVSMRTDPKRMLEPSATDGANPERVDASRRIADLASVSDARSPMKRLSFAAIVYGERDLYAGAAMVLQRLGAAFIVFVALAACSGDDGETAAADAPSTTTTTSPRPQPPRPQRPRRSRRRRQHRRPTPSTAASPRRPHQHRQRLRRNLRIPRRLRRLAPRT